MNGSKVMHRSHDQANMVDVVCLDFIHIAHIHTIKNIFLMVMKFVPQSIFFLHTLYVISDMYLMF